jgi:hypothetical protein
MKWWRAEPRLSQAIRAVITIAWGGTGVALIVGGQIQGWSPLIALKPLPDVLETAVGVFLAVGTGLICWGSSRKADLSERIWREAPGLALVAVAWLCFLVSTAWIHPDLSWVGSGLISAGFIVGCVMRAWALRISYREARRREAIGRSVP